MSSDRGAAIGPDPVRDLIRTDATAAKIYNYLRREYAEREADLEDRVAHLEGENEKLRLRETVLFDIHAALGITWGDDPYAAITRLRGASSPSEEPRP